MTSLARREFHFHNVALIPVHDREDVWFTSSDLAKALGYASTKSISNLYSGNSDEFSDAMSMVIRVMTNGINNNLREKKVRIFSLRGAHLIAMFARTTVAKEFRRWVLDILDREVVHSPIAKQFTDDELYDLACLWSVSQIIRSDAKIVKAAMELVDSPIAKKISKNDADIEYFSDKARNVLLRESQHIAKMANPGLGWKTELNRLNGKGELH